MSETPKERIHDAAVELFAQQGFAATGVRELARHARVNQAMISYYYGSKGGVLEALQEEFFDAYERCARRNIVGDGPLEERVGNFVRELVLLFRQHPELLRITLAELQTEYTVTRVGRLKDLFEEHLAGEITDRRGRAIPLPILGPFVLSAAYSHFLLRPLIEKTGWIGLDDDFYDDLADTIADLVAYGLRGGPKNEPNALSGAEAMTPSVAVEESEL